jgi:[NiFe] hydrogenase assembly HybE family chaperone
MDSRVNDLLVAYRDIVQPRMKSLPVYNAALRIEAVDFRTYQGRSCGVLITPWFMNLVVMPGENDNWSSSLQPTTRALSFPAGEYDFMLSAAEGISPHLSLPLFSSVNDFAEQDTARLVAADIMRRLFEEKSESAQPGSPATQAGRSGWPWSVSRRELLLGRRKPPGSKD